MTCLGFVGVGRHAQKMAAAFRECGAETRCHDRARYHAGDMPESRELDGFGHCQPWYRMVEDHQVDALIICAPPDVTTKAALACAKAGKRCVATKPLMVTSDMLHALPFFVGDDSILVDLWRLYSPAWQALKAELRGKQIQSVHVDFYGKGPVREFSGALDYGPHALAFIADLLGDCSGLSYGTNGPGLWEIFRRPTHAAPGIVITTGNGAKESRMAVRVRTDDADYVWQEKDNCQSFAPTSGDGRSLGYMHHDRSIALRNFCRAFLAGEPSDTLRLSCEAMKVLMPLAGYRGSHSSPASAQ